MYTFKELIKIKKSTHLTLIHKEIKRLKKLRNKNRGWQNYSTITDRMNELRYQMSIVLKEV